MIKYLVCPNHVRSAYDGQRHYIGYCDLIRLYGVDWRECIINSEENFRLYRDRIDDLIRLRPQYDGNYTVPTHARH